MAQPKTNANGLIDRLNSICEMTSPPAEFQLAALRRDIEALKRVDLATGLMVFGVYHACFGSAEDSIDFHRRSISASGGQPMFYENFAVSLKRMGRFIDACDNYLAALRKDPANKFLLLKFANTSFYTGRVSDLSESVDRYVAATGDDSIFQKKLIVINRDLIAQMSALDLSESDFLSAFSKVEDVMRSHGKSPIGASGVLVSDQESSYLFCQIKVSATPSELVAMSDDLARLVAEDFEYSAWNKLVHSFAPAGSSKLMERYEELDA